MQYARLTIPIVSRLAFGAVSFKAGNLGLDSVHKVGAELADESTGRAQDAGVNLFDTADVYAGGDSGDWTGVLYARPIPLLAAGPLSDPTSR